MPKSIRKRLKYEQTPLIDGEKVLFVWRGEEAPYLVGDFTGWESGDPLTMEMIEPNIWIHQLMLPMDAYIEYAFQRGEKNSLDPLNPRKTSNGVGGYNNFFTMPGYKPTKFGRRSKNIPHGTLTTHHVATDYLIMGENRSVHLYQPPVKDPVPLMVVWDGQDYLNRMHLNTIIDNLIAKERIRPLALALVNNGGQKSRVVEYACSEASLAFLTVDVIPLAINNLNLLDIKAMPGAYGVVGASMGGLMALFTGVRLSEIFGNVLCQSGAFSWVGNDSVVFDLLALGKLLPLKIWLDVGIFDIPGLLLSNRKMSSLLNKRGYPFMYREYNAGHNYPAWRDEIWRGIEYLYGKTETSK